MGADSSGVVILPDSRLLSSRRAVSSKAGNMVPIFCANCGKPYGYVPEANCTFVCWLCDPCADRWGEQYGAAYVLTPDEVFWKKVIEEQLDTHGRLLTQQELDALGSTGALSTLIREGV